MAETKSSKSHDAKEYYANIASAFPAETADGRKSVGLVIKGTIQDGKGKFSGPLIDRVGADGVQHSVFLSMDPAKSGPNAGKSPFETFAKAAGIHPATVKAVEKNFDEHIKGATTEDRSFEKLTEKGFVMKMNGKGTNVLYTDNKGSVVRNRVKGKDGQYDMNPDATRVNLVNLNTITPDKDFSREKEDAEVQKRVDEYESSKAILEQASKSNDSKEKSAPAKDEPELG